jgi:NAD(P)-dependent dehydrogenase (short-subunit alcohol dehydrogenase family)
MNVYATYPTLLDRTVPITGGATGIGASLVEYFVAAGSYVGFIDIDDAAGIALASRLSGARHGPRFANADLTDTRAIERAVFEIRAHFGPIGVLLNNAANDCRYSIGRGRPSRGTQGSLSISNTSSSPCRMCSRT